jgi:predicted HAD superfamily Cof-like phosphohydrolase
MKKIKQFVDKIVRAGNPDPLQSAIDHLEYLDEEVSELKAGLNFYTVFSDEIIYATKGSDTSEDEKAKQKNLIETIDGVCDVAFVAFNIGLQVLEDAGYGDRAVEILEKCFEEVKDSNLSKLEDGKPVFREDGKVSKGKDYFKPKIKEILFE